MLHVDIVWCQGTSLGHFIGLCVRRSNLACLCLSCHAGIAPRMPSPAWSRSNSPGLTPLTPDRQGSPRVPHVLAFRATSPPRDTSPPPQSPVSSVSRPLIWQAPQPQARQGLQGPGPQGAQGQSTRPCTPRNVSPAGSVSASGPPAGGFVWGAKLQPQAGSGGRTLL